MDKNKQLRALAIALLDDENGINTKAYDLLQDALGENNEDIFNAVTACEGRFFLPEDHGITA